MADGQNNLIESDQTAHEWIEDIYSRKHKHLINFALGIVKNATDAEDVIQLSYTRALSRLKNIALMPSEEQKRLWPRRDSWMFKIVKNSALNWLRGDSSLSFSGGNEELGDFDAVDVSSTPPLDALAQGERKEKLPIILYQAISLLSKSDQKTAYAYCNYLNNIQGLPGQPHPKALSHTGGLGAQKSQSKDFFKPVTPNMGKAVGEVLGITGNAASIRITRVKKKLRDILGPDMFEEAKNAGFKPTAAQRFLIDSR